MTLASIGVTHLSPAERRVSGVSVNIGSNSFNQFNEFSTNRYIQNVAGSSVQYSKQFGQFEEWGKFKGQPNVSPTAPK